MSDTKRVLFVRLSHSDPLNRTRALAEAMARRGHDVHWVELFHLTTAKPKVTTRRDEDASLLTEHILRNPFGNKSQSTLFDLRAPVPETYLKVLSKGALRAFSDLENITAKVAPEKIVTEGVLALSAIGQMDMNMKLPGTVVPWVHYIDCNYKYGLNVPSPQRGLALKLLRAHIHQPDMLWASERGYASRVTKDFRLAKRPSLIVPQPEMDAALIQAQASARTRFAVIFDSSDPAQLRDMIAVTQGHAESGHALRLDIYDVCPPWPIVAAKPAKVAGTLPMPGLSTAKEIDILAPSPSKPTTVPKSPKEKGLFQIFGDDYSKWAASLEAIGARLHNFQSRGLAPLSGLAVHKQQVLLSLLDISSAREMLGRFLPTAHLSHVFVPPEQKADLARDLAPAVVEKYPQGIFGSLETVQERMVERDQVMTEVRVMARLSPTDRRTSVNAPLDAALSSLEKITRKASQDGDLRVWHGLTGCAGQPWIQSQAQSRAGVFARANIVGPNYLGYPVNKHIPQSGIRSEARMLAEVAERYNVAHFYFRSLFYNSRDVKMPSALDLLALRAAGKVVVMNFRGSEVRLQDDFRRLNPYHYVDENPPAVAKFPDSVQRRYLDFVRAVCSGMTVIDPELGSFVPDATVIPRSLDLKDWSFVGLGKEPRPVVVHAPTKADIKGTSHVLAAIEQLEAEGLDFEFRLIKGLSHADARKAYLEADIIIDQLRIGWYGVLSVEAMSLGKAVMCYIREDISHTLPSGENAPFARTTPDTVCDDLRNLLQNPSLRERYSLAGRRYCETVHDSDNVAQTYLDYYRHLRHSPNPVDTRAVFEFLEWQESLISKETSRLVRKIRRRAGVDS